MNETPNPQCLQCLVRCAHHRIPSPAQHFTSSPSRAVSTPTSYVRRALEKPCAGPHNLSPGLVFPHQFPFDTPASDNRVRDGRLRGTRPDPGIREPSACRPERCERREPSKPTRAGTDQGGPVRDAAAMANVEQPGSPVQSGPVFQKCWQRQPSITAFISMRLGDQRFAANEDLGSGARRWCEGSTPTVTREPLGTKEMKTGKHSPPTINDASMPCENERHARLASLIEPSEVDGGHT